MAYTKADIAKLCKGRTTEQKSVIKYFLSPGGCLGGGLKDAGYDTIVQKYATGTDFKQKALSKIGLDESQISEIDPVHFEGYYFPEKGKLYVKPGKDRKWRSNLYQISWLFFSSTQVYVYQYTFNLDEDTKKESTEEYFYKDITNFSTSSDTIEREDVLVKVSCKGKPEYGRKTVEYDRFALVVPGANFYCSMDRKDDNDQIIQAMKQKLREKKG